MVSLVDIGPLTKKVNIRGNDFEVQGLNVAVIFDILKDNTAVKAMLMDKSVKAEDMVALVNTTPIILGQIIAAALDKFGDEETITFAMMKLYAGEQAAIVQAVIDISFPQGLQTFVDSLTGMFGNAK